MLTTAGTSSLLSTIVTSSTPSSLWCSSIHLSPSSRIRTAAPFELSKSVHHPGRIDGFVVLPHPQTSGSIASQMVPWLIATSVTPLGRPSQHVRIRPVETSTRATEFPMAIATLVAS